MNTGAPTRPTVLLVEDHVDSRLMYVEFLREQFEVLEAGDGLGAMDVLAGTVPDVLVTDLALPRMDGFALIERVRAEPRLQRMAIIALSGYSADEHETRARALGAWRVLQKPCLPEDLAEAVAGAASSRNNPS